jgi:FHS family Na+ dependent glucose MFS transporter 1
MKEEDKTEDEDILTEKQQSRVAGCIVTKDDLPIIIVSLICCLIFILHGAAAASLGPALPFLAKQFHKSIADMSMAFTTRGVGSLIGTILSGYLLTYHKVTFTKEFLSAITLIIMGLTLILVVDTTNFTFCLVLFFIQGLTFGIIETLSNCVLPEMWGHRVQPWMQAVHSCFGVGAMLGPSLIGGIGYETCFLSLFIISVFPCIGILLTTSFGYGRKITFSDDRSPPIDPHSSDSDDDQRRPSPFYLKCVVSIFFFCYVGSETGFAGWIPTYALLQGITEDESKAAYLSAVFWASLTVGRIVSVFCAIFLSASFMLKIQLSLAIISGILSMTLLTYSYSMAMGICSIAGFALASIFPVMMTIFGDYGYAIDASSTTLFLVGATFGESLVPVFIGILMMNVDIYMMPITVFFCILCLVVLFIVFHVLSRRERSSSYLLNNNNQGGFHKLCDDANISYSDEHAIELIQPSHTLHADEVLERNQTELDQEGSQYVRHRTIKHEDDIYNPISLVER